MCAAKHCWGTERVIKSCVEAGPQKRPWKTDIVWHLYVCWCLTFLGSGVAWQDQEQSENSEDAHLNWTRIRGIEAWPFPPFFLFLVENGIGLVSVWKERWKPSFPSRGTWLKPFGSGLAWGWALQSWAPREALKPVYTPRVLQKPCGQCILEVVPKSVMKNHYPYFLV